MAHSHDHDHSHGDHRLEHVCTLIISGLLGLVSVLLYQRNALNLILAKQFHIPVLLGGISLLILVGLSALAGLLAPKAKTDCEGEACHDHGHCDHEHHHEHANGHDHVHGHGDETVRLPAHVHAHEHTHEVEVGHEHVVACEHDHDHGHTHEHGAACDHTHDHDHEHGHTHGHDHAHAHGGHDHGHDHGWNPWRYIVLLLPVVLYFLNLPNSGFSASYMMRGMHTGELDSGAAIGRSVENTGMRIDKPTGQDYPLVAALTEGGPAAKAGLQLKDTLVSVTKTTDNDGKPLAKPETIDFKGMPIEQVVASLAGKPQTKLDLAVDRGTEKQKVEVTRKADIIDLQFLELNDAALSPERRAFYSGKIGRLKGQFLQGANGRMFSLARIRIRCCAADTTMLNIIILLDDKVPPGSLEKIKPQDWVQVTGEIQFRKLKNRDEYQTVMLVSHASDIQPTDPDPEVYLTQ